MDAATLCPFMARTPFRFSQSPAKSPENNKSKVVSSTDSEGQRVTAVIQDATQGLVRPTVRSRPRTGRRAYRGDHTLSAAPVGDGRERTLERALEGLNAAARAAPLAAEAHLRRGAARLAAGAVDEATDAFVSALDAMNASAAVRNAFGEVLLALELAPMAEEQFVRAVSLSPHLFRARLNLGRTRALLGRHAEALEEFAAVQSAARGRDGALALAYASASLDALRRSAEAVAAADAAVALDPDLAEGFFAKGQACVSAGRLNEAEAAFRRAIRLSPDAPHYYRALAEWIGLTAQDPAWTGLKRLAKAAETLGQRDRRQLYFALASAYDVQGRYPDALECWIKANALERRRVAYDERQTLSLLEAIAQTFTGELITRLAGSGLPSAAPIFIVGMPRSGTTLVEQILSAHPAVTAGGELTALAEAIHAESAFADAEPLARAVRAVGARYLAATGPVRGGFAHLTDKMPGNFLHLGLIHLALPNAKIVHIHRDPADTCLSCFTKAFSAGPPFANDLGELGRFYRGYERLMAHWRSVLPAGRIIEVRYEDLVTSYQGEARRLLSHCGLGWDDRCLTPERVGRPVHTASAAQVRKPVFSTSLGRAARYGQALRPLIEALA